MWLVGLLALSAMFPATLLALLLSMPGLLCGLSVLSVAAFGVAPPGAFLGEDRSLL